ncbi:MAG: hypothetical protein RL274_1419 [Pseudomonadota bacterium]|jgi:polysaccharide deacetylase 2 family uncharacterized protein YibQ
MDRETLIRRACDVAFVALLAGAVATGGGAALAGLPKFVESALPGMAAQAKSEDGARGRTQFVLAEGFAKSRYAPQVLYPVTASAFPDWLAHPTPALRGVREAPARPVIAICIDDLGEDIAGTDRAMMLPKEVALSFLPYADTTPFLAEAAAKRGHLILAHVPMQPLSGSTHAPMTLNPDMTADEITRRLDWNLARVPGIAGINNHEGSRFTTDAASLTPVMVALKARRLFFFDSRTGPGSRAERVASDMGVMSAGRDIFLDDVPGEAEVAAQLAALVREARRRGVAIAIGHPRDSTLRLLKKFLAQDHGVTLVPLDEAMRLKASRGLMVAAR